MDKGLATSISSGTWIDKGTNIIWVIITSPKIVGMTLQSVLRPSCKTQALRSRLDRLVTKKNKKKGGN